MISEDLWDEPKVDPNYHNTVDSSILNDIDALVNKQWEHLYNPESMSKINHTAFQNSAHSKVPGIVFRQCFGFLLKEFRGQGLFNHVLSLTEILAFEDGYDYAISENTTPVTQRAFRHFPGYSTLVELPFSDMVLPHS